MDSIVKQAFLRHAFFGHIKQCADTADDFTIRTDNGSGAQTEPAELAILGAATESFDAHLKVNPRQPTPPSRCR